MHVGIRSIQFPHVLWLKVCYTSYDPMTWHNRSLIFSIYFNEMITIDSNRATSFQLCIVFWNLRQFICSNRICLLFYLFAVIIAPYTCSYSICVFQNTIETFMHVHQILSQCYYHDYHRQQFTTIGKTVLCIFCDCVNMKTLEYFMQSVYEVNEEKFFIVYVHMCM